MRHFALVAAVAGIVSVASHPPARAQSPVEERIIEGAASQPGYLHDGQSLLSSWGFRKVAFPGQPTAIWAPLGLGLSVKENRDGLTFVSYDGRVTLYMFEFYKKSLQKLHDGIVLKEKLTDKRHVLHNADHSVTQGWFFIDSEKPAIPARSNVAPVGAGPDRYYTYYQTGEDVLGFTLEWDHAAADMHVERIAAIMSGSLRAAMLHMPFPDPPGPSGDVIADPLGDQIQAARDAQARADDAARERAAEDRQPQIVGRSAASAEGCWSIKDARERLSCYDSSTGSVAPQGHLSALTDPLPPAPERTAPAAIPDTIASRDFSAADLPAMHSTYEMNQARFTHDYVGAKFSDDLHVDSVIERVLEKGTFSISFDQNVSCAVEDRPTIDLITDLNKGDRVRVSGTIDDHVLGSVVLRDCRIER